jgi:hypothetical protein
MMGIPFHSETASGVPIERRGVLVEARLGTAVRVNVGIVVGLVCIKLVQALRTSMNENRLTMMGFFTRPSL